MQTIVLAVNWIYEYMFKMSFRDYAGTNEVEQTTTSLFEQFFSNAEIIDFFLYQIWKLGRIL